MIKREIEEKRIVSLGVEELMGEIEKKTREVEKSEEKYRELVKNAVEGIYRTMIDGKFLEVNPAFLNILGYESEEELKAIGDISKTYQNPKDRKKFLKKLKKDGEIKGWEGYYRRKDGRPIITNEFARLIEKDGEEIIEGIVHDVTEERKATISLKKSREKYRDLFENANDLIWTADREGRYLSVNKMFEKALGYNRKELIGSQSLDLISEKDKKESIKYYKKTLHGEPQSYELEIETNDGDKRIFMFKTRPIEENGKIISVHGIGRDITERKQMEVTLRKSEERYRTQFEETMDAIFVADAETGILVDCNSAALELVGREKSELVGKHQRILHPLEKIEGGFSSTFKWHLKEKEGQILETQVITKKGEVKDVAIKANLFELEGKKVLLGIFRDITERKQAEEVLRESEEKYRTLTENINVGIYRNTSGPKGKFIEANPAIVKMFGYDKKEDFLKFNVSDLYQNPEDRKKTNEKMLKDGFVRNEEIWLKRKDGTPIWGSVTAVTVHDEKGNAKYYDGIIEDITERKQAEEEAEFYNSLLRHDVGNRNQVTMGYLDLLKETDLSEEQREFVEKVLVATKRSNGLIKKVRDLEKLKEKRELEDVSVDAVMDKVIKSFSKEVKDNGIKINYEPAKMMVKADSLLEDMFSNLVQNAINHSKCDEINIYATNEKGFCKISIEDNGKGIPDDEKEKIFQRMIKGKESRGSGVGLYLVKKIVESYNGKVEVTNRIKEDYSKGTIFNVYIPRG